MGIAANHIDRLLPRHEATINLDLDWNIRTGRAGFMRAREELYDLASIIDISLEGARIAVDAKVVHQVGDHVAVRFRGIDGEAVVRHVDAPDGHRRTYGIRFLPNLTLSDAVNDAVGEIRGDSAALRQAWQRQN